MCKIQALVIGSWLDDYTIGNPRFYFLRQGLCLAFSYMLCLHSHPVLLSKHRKKPAQWSRCVYSALLLPLQDLWVCDYLK